MNAADRSAHTYSALPTHDIRHDARRASPVSRRFASPRQISAATVAMAIVAWAVASRLELVSPVFMPSPLSVARKFVAVALDGSSNPTLLEHTLASLNRMLAALLLAIVTAIPIGIVTGLNRVAQAMVDPLIEFYRPIPPLAYLPLIVIWCGIGEGSVKLTSVGSALG
jgi:taurine transport system permease protein